MSLNLLTKKILVAAMAVAVAIPAWSENKGRVIFEDNFSTADSIPDPSVWMLCYYKTTVWAQYFRYVNGYENVRVEDGVLKLRACKDGDRYKNGGVRTKYGFEKNTRLEVRARLTKLARGCFPAIWQMPIDGLKWPKSGEIDLMEWIQSTPKEFYQTVHTYFINGDTGSSGATNLNRDRNFDVTQYHVYAAERTDEAVIFYVDGKETFRYENQHLPDEAQRLQFPFCNYDYDIILNCSLGGTFNGNSTWPGPIADEDLPVEMWIDWVRVTKCK